MATNLHLVIVILLTPPYLFISVPRVRGAKTFVSPWTLDVPVDPSLGRNSQRFTKGWRKYHVVDADVAEVSRWCDTYTTRNVSPGCDFPLFLVTLIAGTTPFWGGSCDQLSPQNIHPECSETLPRV